MSKNIFVVFIFFLILRPSLMDNLMLMKREIVGEKISFCFIIFLIFMIQPIVSQPFWVSGASAKKIEENRIWVILKK